MSASTTFFWAAVLNATSRCTAHACRLQKAHPVMLPRELQALPWNALHGHRKAHWLPGCSLQAGHDVAPCRSLDASCQASQHPVKANIQSVQDLQSIAERSCAGQHAAAGLTWISLPSSRCCSAVVSSLSISSSLKATLISTAESWSLASEVLSSSPSLQDATSFWMSMFLLSLHASGPYKLCRNGGQLVQGTPADERACWQIQGLGNRRRSDSKSLMLHRPQEAEMGAAGSIQILACAIGAAAEYCAGCRWVHHKGSRAWHIAHTIAHDWQRQPPPHRSLTWGQVFVLNGVHKLGAKQLTLQYSTRCNASSEHF